MLIDHAHLYGLNTILTDLALYLSVDKNLSVFVNLLYRLLLIFILDFFY